MIINLGKGKYILDTLDDPWAKAAMEAYADACNISNPAQAESIRLRIGVAFGSFACIETALRIVNAAHSLASMQEGYSKHAWDQVYGLLESLGL
jgi:hypothetical protein